MRQNGLRASSFVPVVDVDPRVADQLLDLLRLADVAAYSEPAPGATGVYRDHHVSSRRLDRLWVDRTETLRARGVLDRALPHLQAELDLAIRDGVVLDRESGAGDLLARSARASAEPAPDATGGPARAESAGITSGVDAGLQASAGLPTSELQSTGGPAGPAAGGGPLGEFPVAEPARPEAPAGDVPAAEVVPGRAARGADDGEPPRTPSEPDEEAIAASWAQIVAGFDDPIAGPSPWPAVEDLPGPRIARLRRPVRASTPPPAADPTDDGEHFVPPPPLPLPRLDPMTRLGWAAVVGGPVLLVLVVLFGSSLPGWVPLLGVLTLVGGFGLLVSRLRPSSADDDSDHHDGAVV